MQLQLQNFCQSGALFIVSVIIFVTAAEGRTINLKLPSYEDENVAPPDDVFQPKEELETFTPLIGILSQPGDGDGYEIMKNHSQPDAKPTNISYIAASYVKFVEAGGARVVPIVYNEPEETLIRKFKAINALLIPGGGAKKSGPFFERVKKLIDLAIEANDNKDYFPIQAVCLGFEMIAMVVSKEGESVLSRYMAQKPSTLKFVAGWAKHRSMFAWMQPKLVEKLSTEKATMQNHIFGLAPETVATNAELSNFFTVLTTSEDENGKEYVSTMEAKQYPFIATQWHPEKNAFEWGNPAIPHFKEAIQVTHASAAFFVNEARKSSHKPASKEEENQLLIYNYNPYFSGKDGVGHFDQSYVFQCSDGADADCLLDS